MWRCVPHNVVLQRSAYGTIRISPRMGFSNTKFEVCDNVCGGEMVTVTYPPSCVKVLWRDVLSTKISSPWEVFQMLCGERWGKWQILEGVREYRGRTNVQLTSGFTEWELFQNLCGTYTVRAVYLNLRETMWRKHFSPTYHLVSQRQNALKFFAKTYKERAIPSTLWNGTVGRPSPQIWFHEVRKVWVQCMRGLG